MNFKPEIILYFSYKNMASINFDIEKFDNGNAYMISGIQVQSGVPVNGQVLTYSGPVNQWTYGVPSTIAGIPVQTGVPADNQILKYNLSLNEWRFVNP